MAVCTEKCRQLEKLQQKIVNNLFSRFYNSSSCLFKTMGFLKLKDAYKLRAATYMFRILNHGEFPQLKDQLNIQFPNHDHGTRSMLREELVVPFPRVEAIRINYGYQFINIWNSIPLHLKSVTNLKSFKKSLSKYYINMY